MLQRIKKLLPKPIKSFLLNFKEKTYDQLHKKNLFKRMPLKHAEFVRQIKGKEKVTVVFLVIHKSVWKVDSVFKKMLDDPFFEPEILVCPYTSYGKKRMLEDMKEAYTYFFDKGYPVRKSLKESGDWLTLNEINPDIIFFTNPHPLTLSHYYEDAYLNYLSCYVPYHHEVGFYSNGTPQYNRPFHNALWRIFGSNKESFDISKKTAVSKGANVRVSGYPAMEAFIDVDLKSSLDDVWKNNDERLRVIWAPHHTIDSPSLPYSNFLTYAEDFQKLAINNRDKMVWAFKPHPILKSKLYTHPSWGKTKTDDFYRFWSENEFTQLEESEYISLFCFSDAMIHDSGSFLAEYLYLEKPVMYLLSTENNQKYYSEFGLKALSSCEIGKSLNDIERFLGKMVLGNKDLKPSHNDFLRQEVFPFFETNKPSERIVEEIKSELK